VAVAAGDSVLGLKHLATTHGQAEALLPLVDTAMREAGLPASALDLVTVTTGPGSFTGIRVGLAAARGISLGLDVPLLGVTGFEAAVAAVCDPDPVERFLLVALESRRADLYIQLFGPAYRPLGAPAAVLPEALAEIVTAHTAGRPLAITGDGAARAATALAARGCASVVEDGALPAVGALRAALRRWRHGERGSPARPLYLRPPDVTLASGPRSPGQS
jgi:tRNA threonylcarbamoyladenosine biosynthesis protein TsaB